MDSHAPRLTLEFAEISASGRAAIGRLRTDPDDLIAQRILSRFVLPYLDTARTGILIRIKTADLSEAAWQHYVRTTPQQNDVSGDANPLMADDQRRSGDASAHLRLAFSCIPDIPPALASWRPQTQYGYRDLGRPRSAEELLLRVDELLRVGDRLTHTAAPPAARVRAAYAFFDAACFWAHRELAQYHIR